MDYLAVFKNVLALEARALESASARLNEKTLADCARLFEWLTQMGGSLVVCGVGKSGLIGKKIAATFSSLGLPSFFLHPTEAMHGDLGRVTKSDVMLFISKSGTTEEILDLLPYLQLPKERLIALVGQTQSPIAQKCGVVLDCHVDKEACLNDLAPTTSTTVALAMGDALAVLYEAIRGVSKEQFALNHPAGLLGKTLSLTVEKLMTPADQCAVVKPHTTLQESLLVMTKHPLGLLAIVEGSKLLGILVEGDIRRALMKDAQALSKLVTDFMNKNPRSVSPSELAFNALKLMEDEQRPVYVLPVMEAGEFKGVLRLHDLLQAGFTSSAGTKKS